MNIQEYKALPAETRAQLRREVFGNYIPDTRSTEAAELGEKQYLEVYGEEIDQRAHTRAG